MRRSIWFIWFVWFSWLSCSGNEIHETNQKHQIDQTNQSRCSLWRFQRTIGTVKGGLLANRLGTGFQSSCFVGMMSVA